MIFPAKGPGPAELIPQNLIVISLVVCFASMCTQTIFYGGLIQKAQYNAEAFCALEQELSFTICTRLAIHSHITNNCKPVRKNVIFLCKIGKKQYN